MNIYVSAASFVFFPDIWESKHSIKGYSKIVLKN